VSQEKPIAPPWWEVVDDYVLPERVRVEPHGTGDRAAVMLGGIRVICTAVQWAELNTAVVAGFANLQPREIPARTDGAA
jgi:hypothetical protein